MKKFDLNIEKILENWEVKHAIRELIANALDEAELSNTIKPSISCDSENKWHIRDYGRGIKYEHLTQNENNEKLSSEGIIGRFGIGLKDALATFDRHSVNVKIISKHGDFELGKSSKAGFDDVITLHAYISEPSDAMFEGTDFVLTGVHEEEIEEAKLLFLCFNDDCVIEKTSYGSVLNKEDCMANIYINGVQVAKEENFLFSYNITLLNSAIKKALNRERENVGRSAYTSTIKSILLECESDKIKHILTEDLSNFSLGTCHDEMKWIDIQQHTANLLNENRNVLFVTSDDVETYIDTVNEARETGKSIVVIPNNLSEKLIEQNNELEPEDRINTLNEFVTDRSNNFKFEFISENEFDWHEKRVWKKRKKIMHILSDFTKHVKEIKISKTMQTDILTFTPASGLWIEQEGVIILHRRILKKYELFLSVLVHEIAHSSSSASDSSRKFETELTNIIGKLCYAII